ncbi:hypothetical protein [Aliivibrio fischeri]|uniref:WYL domain-containing protein n=1 Tax=Aliivibrio fischeri TaxID=668 RepID=A0A844P0B5_ALIFS|nr:hypothetical protein [Aliivibrio fischeri]MUK48666.1 hypothetical protein [Aliivibrio fischeri]
MKLGLKIGVVLLPIPSLYWVYKQSNPLWIKIISSLWTIFVSIVQLGSFLSDDGFSGYPSFAIVTLICFFTLHGIYSGIRSLVNKKKGGIPSSSKSPIIQEISKNTFGISKPIEENEPELAIGNETLTPRRARALYTLALKILADDEVDLEESKKLRSWLLRYPESQDDNRTQLLYTTVKEVLKDKVLEKEEALELFALLSEYCDQHEKSEATEEAKKLEKQLKKKASTFKRSSPNSTSFIDQLEFGHEYFMSYQDANGNASDRNIVLHSVNINAQQQYYIKAHCLLRNSIRTFRADRIVNICNVDTGEVVL